MPKTHCSLGLIANDEQTNNNLFQAISKVCSSTSTPQPSFETASRKYTLFNLIADVDFINYSISTDAFVLIMDATKRPTKKVLDFLSLAAEMKVSNIIVFLGNCDTINDAEKLQLIDMEIRQLFYENKLDDKNMPIICGSLSKALEGQQTWLAKITEFVNACDKYIQPPFFKDKPLFMPIEDVFEISGRGTVATGRVLRGTLHLNDKVACVGHGKNDEYFVTAIEQFRKDIDEALPGDSVGVLLRGAQRKDLARGMVIATPNSVSEHTEFKAKITTLTKDEGGRHSPFFNNYRPQIYFFTDGVTGTLEFPPEVNMVFPGDALTAIVKLSEPFVLEAGTPFAVREGGRTVGKGVVIQIIK